MIEGHAVDRTRWWEKLLVVIILALVVFVAGVQVGIKQGRSLEREKHQQTRTIEEVREGIAR